MIANLLLGVIVVLFAGYFLIEAASLPARARMFPEAVLCGIALVGMLISIGAVVGRLRGQEPDGNGALASALVWQIAIPGGMLVHTYVLSTFVGFYFAVPVLLLAV